jgi:hypothetical protein
MTRAFRTPHLWNGAEFRDDACICVVVADTFTVDNKDLFDAQDDELLNVGPRKKMGKRSPHLRLSFPPEDQPLELQFGAKLR